MANDEVLVKGKALIQSTEFWVNVIGFSVEVLQYLDAMHIVPPGTAGMATAIATILLRRFKTSQPVTATFGSAPPASVKAPNLT